MSRWSRVWRNADAVCFDVDSTLSQDEGIDILASVCGVGDEVAEWTHRAMGGGTTFEQALAARLEIIKPSQQQIEVCLKQHPPAFTPHVQDVIAELQNQSKSIYLVSGGFTQMIYPMAEILGIPKNAVFANKLRFKEDGSYGGYDDEAFTAWTGGKQRALNWIKSTFQHKNMVMIGDGITDLEARPPADIFIAYTGIHEREKVVQGADYACSDFNELLSVLKTQQDA